MAKEHRAEKRLEKLIHELVHALHQQNRLIEKLMIPIATLNASAAANALAAQEIIAALGTVNPGNVTADTAVLTYMASVDANTAAIVAALPVTPIIPLTITTQPASATVAVGAPFTLTVVATGGTSPLSYQWSQNGTLLPAETAPSLSVVAAAAATDAGTYTVVVTDSATPSASVTSDGTAVVTVA